MKQRLHDIILLLKQEKKYQVMTVFAVLAILYVTLSDGGSSRRMRSRQNAESNQITLSDKEAYKDIVSAVTEDLSSIKAAQQENTKQINEIETNIEDDRTRVAEIFRKMLDRLAETQGSQNAVGGMPGGNPAAMNVAMGGMPEADPMADNTLASFGDTNEPAIAPPEPPAPKKQAVIMPGDSVRVKLLAGVNAPTDGTPYPVVFKLVSNIEGPDSSSLPLGEARLVAAAQGSLTDSRVLFRLTTMNVRLPNGQKKEIPVDGWVVGEDGIRGMEGILIDPIGKAIAGAAEAGLIQGIGQGFASSQVTTNDSWWGDGSSSTVTGDPAKYALGKGIAGAGNEIVGMIKERAALAVPVVSAYSGREGVAVFSKTVTVEDLFETIQESENNFAAGVD